MENHNNGSVDDFGTQEEENSEFDGIDLDYWGTEEYETKKSGSKKVTGEKDVHLLEKAQWASSGHNRWLPVGKTKESLPPGYYTISTDNSGIAHYTLKKLVIDELMILDDPIMTEIIEEIENFWDRGDLFKKYGFLHRRGYMLYGPPGSGKTALVSLIIQAIVKKGGIVFECSGPSTLEEGLKQFREVEPNRPIICVFEDVDAIIQHYGEDDLLSVLDGESKVDKVLNLATTNYPERLDKRVVNRPRRFDRIIRIGMPSEKVRRQYFTQKLNLNKKEANKWVTKTDKYSFAAMADLVVSVKCLGIPLDSAIDRLNDLLFVKKDSEGYDKEFGQEKKKVGFG